MNSYDLCELKFVLAEQGTMMRRLIRGVLRELGVQDIRCFSSVAAGRLHDRHRPGIRPRKEP